MSKPKRGKTIKPKLAVASIFVTPSKEREAAIERIVKSTGREPDDRDKLVKDIESALRSFELQSSGKKDRTRKRIRQGFENLAKLVKTSPEAKEVLKGIVDFDKASAALRLLEDGGALLSIAPLIIAKAPKGLRPTPFDYFVYDLARIFEARFAAKAGFSRGEGARPKGAFIAFVEAVLAELGLHIDRQTIGRAFTQTSRQRKQYRAYIELVGQKI